MAARFGRNKRRAAREEIAQLMAANNLKIRHIERMSQELAALRSDMQAAKEIAGEMSVIFPGKTIRFDGEPRREINVEQTPAWGQRFDAYSKTIRLPVLIAKIDKDALSEAIHCLFEFDGKQIGYAISNYGLKARGSFLVNELATVLPRILAAAIQQEK